MKRLCYRTSADNLSGAIPLAVYDISSLKVFIVKENQIQGSLPPNLGFRLSNLAWLSIAENQIDGLIPISMSKLKLAIHFGGLSKLTVLSLSTNHFRSGEADDLSFINTMTNCTNLTTLELCTNHFGNVLPNSIENLSTQLNWLSDVIL
ncbi:hypothetical protein NE237_013260 [Protea cynaroides]|uniref:Uncharacterized protein n=1 Tax=Protea cynaroides TaxID=273540 RepID=A0A9Q0JYS9_9MAGN|nr:hypothetical protein NE237_013260 [Protea cynaroides]